MTGTQRALAGLTLAVGSLAVAGCGSSGDEAQERRAELTREARAAVAYADKTSSLAAQVARLPRTMNKPEKAVAKARELESRAKKLQRYSEQPPQRSTTLDAAYDDLSQANRQLARSARGIQSVAIEVRDGSREPQLTGVARNLKRANGLLESAYTEIDQFVASELAGSLAVQTPASVKLSKVKLPPLPDLIFNMNDAGEAQVGDWSPSPVSSEISSAIAVYGAPDIACGQQTEGNLGKSEWTGIGMTVTQADFSGRAPCEGGVQIVQVSGEMAKQWVTEAGLRVGDPESKVLELYPGATDMDNPQSPGEAGLILARTEGAVPRDLVALTEGGSVVGLRIWVGGAGE